VNSTVTVDVGGIPVGFHGVPDTFREVFLERYRGFQIVETPSVGLGVTIAESPGTSINTGEVRIQRTSTGWRLERGDFRCEVSADLSSGSLRTGMPNPYTLDSALRILHTLLVAPRGGFLLHASSAVRNGRAFIFTGLSGAGKTTISRLAPPDVKLLADEISYVRPLDGTYAAFGTPFAKETAAPGHNINAPIGYVYILAQGPENRIDTVDSGEAIRKLMRNVLFFSQDAELTNMVFQSVCDFVARVPIRRLTFVPDPRVWELIR